MPQTGLADGLAREPKAIGGNGFGAADAFAALHLRTLLVTRIAGIAIGAAGAGEKVWRKSYVQNHCKTGRQDGGLQGSAESYEGSFAYLIID